MKPTAHHRNSKRPATRLPVVSLAIVAAACLVMAFPTLADWLQYDRSAVAGGQLWRVATCHLTHCSIEHLFWDAAALLFLGFVLEADKRPRLLTCIGLSALLIPPTVHALMPELDTYRGLSGIDSAVFMLLAVTVLSESWQRRDWTWTAVCIALITGFATKTGFEFATGTTLFVNSTAAEMLPVPLAHVVGAAVGILCGLNWSTLAGSPSTSGDRPSVPGRMLLLPVDLRPSRSRS